MSRNQRLTPEEVTTIIETHNAGKAPVQERSVEPAEVSLADDDRPSVPKDPCPLLESIFEEMEANKGKPFKPGVTR